MIIPWIAQLVSGRIRKVSVLERSKPATLRVNQPDSPASREPHKYIHWKANFEEVDEPISSGRIDDGVRLVANWGGKACRGSEHDDQQQRAGLNTQAVR